MVDLDREPALAEPMSELEHAPRVAGRHHLGPGRRDPVELSGEELPGDLGLHQVVYPGRAAAEIGLAELRQAQSGDRAKHGPRRFPHPLTVHQVTRLMIRDAKVEGPSRAW